jgi:hypothetical protein
MTRYFRTICTKSCNVKSTSVLSLITSERNTNGTCFYFFCSYKSKKTCLQGPHLPAKRGLQQNHVDSLDEFCNMSPKRCFLWHSSHKVKHWGISPTVVWGVSPKMLGELSNRSPNVNITEDCKTSRPHCDIASSLNRDTRYAFNFMDTYSILAYCISL